MGKPSAGLKLLLLVPLFTQYVITCAFIYSVYETAGVETNICKLGKNSFLHHSGRDYKRKTTSHQSSRRTYNAVVRTRILLLVPLSGLSGPRAQKGCCCASA